MKRGINWKTLGRTCGFVLLVLATIFIFSYFKPELVREIVLTHPYSELIYVLLWTFLPIGFFPVYFLAFAGGMGYGMLKGCLLTMVGTTFNMTLMFFISRYLFREPVQNFVFSRYPQVKRTLTQNKRGLRIALVVARLMPLIPYNVENYAFGLTDMNYWEYIIISFFMILPGNVIYVNVGDKMLDTKSPSFIISIILMLLLIFGTVFLARFLNTDDKEKKEDVR